MQNSTSNSLYLNKITALLPTNLESCIVLGFSIIIGYKLHQLRPDLFNCLTYDYKLTLVVQNDAHFLSKNAILKHTTSASVSKFSMFQFWLKF